MSRDRYLGHSPKRELNTTLGETAESSIDLNLGRVEIENAAMDYPTDVDEVWLDSLRQLMRSAATSTLSPDDAAMFSDYFGLEHHRRSIAEISRANQIRRTAVKNRLTQAVASIRSSAAIRSDVDHPGRNLVDLVREYLGDKPEAAAERLYRVGKALRLDPAGMLTFAGLATPNASALQARMKVARRAYYESRLQHRVTTRPERWQSKRAELIDRVQSLIDNAIWPGTPRIIAPEYLVSLGRARTVGDGPRAGLTTSLKSGEEVAYESDVERKVLIDLDSTDLVGGFKEQPIFITYGTDGHVRRYFPDVFVRLADGRGLYVEIKPLIGMASRLN